MTKRRPVDSLGARIDALYKAQQRRLAQQRKVAELRVEEKTAEDAVVDALQGAGLTKASGKKASVSIKPNTVCRVDPAKWSEVFQYIAETDGWDLLYKRLSNEAFRARVDLGVAIPGTTAVPVLDVSLRKI